MSRSPRLLLDGSSIESETDLHSALADLLGFFDGYGRNLDALRDVLADEDLREVKGPVEVLWTHGAKFAKDHPDCYIKVRRLFAEAPGPIRLIVAL